MSIIDVKSATYKSFFPILTACSLPNTTERISPPLIDYTRFPPVNAYIRCPTRTTNMSVSPNYCNFSTKDWLDVLCQQKSRFCHERILLYFCFLLPGQCSGNRNRKIQGPTIIPSTTKSCIFGTDTWTHQGGRVLRTNPS